MENLNPAIIHPIFNNVKYIKYQTIKEMMIFKNIDNLYIKNYSDPSDYEEQLDTIIQKLDSSEILFGYMQYIESIYMELLKNIDEEIIHDIINRYINYDFSKDKNYPTLDSIFDISSSNQDFHMRALIKIFAFPMYSKLKLVEGVVNGNNTNN